MAKYHATVKTKALPTHAALKWRLFGLGILLVGCAVVATPQYFNRALDWINAKSNIGLPRLPEQGFNLGLDLQGGAHLIYVADVKNIPEDDRTNAVEGVRDVVERRVRGGLGVAEPVVQTTRVGNEYRLIVELPGVTDVKQAIRLIGETPVLEFKEQNNDPPRGLTAEETKQLADFNAQAAAKISRALASIRSGQDFGAVAAKFSEDKISQDKGGDLGFIGAEAHPEIYAWAAKHRDGEVSREAIKSFDGLNLVKRLASRAGKRVSAAHILICYEGAARCDQTQYSKSQAQKKISEIKQELTPQNFSDLAKKYSTEPGAANSGGALGFFSPGQLVPEFETAVWNAATGTIIGPVETAFGYHLILKQAEAHPTEYQVARIFLATKKDSDFLPPREAWKTTGLSGKQLKRAEVAQNQQTGEIQVSLQFNDEGTKLFADITGRNVNKPVAIFLDGSPISEPRVNEAILSGSAVISGGFTLVEAKQLSQRLNSGALPVPIELVSQQAIDASLGADSLDKSFRAGILGLILVMIFMIIFYRLPGVLSVFSLIGYALLNLAIFKLIGVTLTLSGIAAFIFSIGMAVDTNVLVFERLKEELVAGRGLKFALEEAFSRSWPSIRDSHVTALLSCVFLIWIGTGFIKGFAVVLFIGTLVSLFSAIIITRLIMRLVFWRWSEKGNWWVLAKRQ